MNTILCRALIGPFLVAAILTPSAAHAYFEIYSPFRSAFSMLQKAIWGAHFLFPSTTEERREPADGQNGKEVTPITLVITAYSSSPDETDEDPFITAAGTVVREGIVATNLLPFGTKIKIPEHFGDKVFVVEDRMHRRFPDRVDIWFPSKIEALNFGKKISDVVIVES